MTQTLYAYSMTQPTNMSHYYMTQLLNTNLYAYSMTWHSPILWWWIITTSSLTQAGVDTHVC